MLSREENDLITQTGPGTPMGEVFRRFWIPAVLASEISEPDGPPVEVTLLSERLIAFRTTDGRAVLMDARCPHRHANLYWGRNEDNCIRCVYHGWQFDADGACVDMPAEPDTSRFKERVRITTYATHECAGIVWAFMGPQDAVPPFPRFDFAMVPETHTLAGKRRVPCNYLQNLEGEMDTAHVNFLHNEFGVTGGPVMKPSYQLQTRFLIASTLFGLVAAARREYPNDAYYWRMTPFILPSFTIIPSTPDLKHLTAAVPMDDVNMWGFTVSWRPDRPMDADDRELFFSGQEQQIEIDPKTFLAKYNRANDYGIDRTKQKTASFTGITGTRLQDCAVQEDQDGPCLRRWEEHLGTTDRAIIATRRRLLALARGLQEGVEPIEPSHPDAFLVRSIVEEAPRSMPWRDVWDGAQPQGAVLDQIAADG
jgi:nitrite reductase/ring-hydroxylating ferredoxin subunit